MRVLVQIVAIVIFGYIFEMFLPWYSVAFVAAVFGFVLRSGNNFIGGFLGVVFLWGLKIYMISDSASVDLASKVARIMEPVGEKWILIVVTLVLGGLVGGLACVTGAAARKEKREYY